MGCGASIEDQERIQQIQQLQEQEKQVKTQLEGKSILVSKGKSTREVGDTKEKEEQLGSATSP